VGNLFRCDDGAGIHVVNKLREMQVNIDTLDVALGSVEILEAMKGYQTVIIVDAVVTGEEPGSIFFVKLPESGDVKFAGSHGIDLITTLELGKQLYGDDMPEELIVVGIEASDVTQLTENCTPEVTKAVNKVVNKIIEIIG
jgi:hydrogenase maturation protease